MAFERRRVQSGRADGYATARRRATFDRARTALARSRETTKRRGIFV